MTGRRHMSLNVHSILHVPQSLKYHGPLNQSSCFPYESALGELRKMVHSPHNIGVQVYFFIFLFFYFLFFYFIFSKPHIKHRYGKEKTLPIYK